MQKHNTPIPPRHRARVEVSKMALPITFTRPRKGNPKAVCFELFEPPADAICPITQDPICSSKLEFLCDEVVSPSKPRHTGVRLACKHEFTAMCLLYHWARNGNVRCPVCRGGPKDGRVNLLELPVHFRSEMRRRIKAERSRDHDEHVLENEEAARQFDHGHWFVSFLNVWPCFCVVDEVMLMMDGRLENNVCVFTAEYNRAADYMVCMLVDSFCKTRFPTRGVTTFTQQGSTIKMTMPLYLFQIYAEHHEAMVLRSRFQ